MRGSEIAAPFPVLHGADTRYRKCMQKKLTITLDEQVYEGLCRKVGRRRISRFLERLARPHVVDEDLAVAYRAMAADKQRELDAREWVENLAAVAPHEAG